MRTTNFGGNITFTSRTYYTPKTEDEVLAILNKHKNGKIRVVSSLHCWSDAVVSEDSVINLQFLNGVRIKEENGEVRVVAQGGAILRDLLDYIHAHSDCTLPAMGGIPPHLHAV